MGGMFGIQRNADPEKAFFIASSVTHRSPRATLRPSIVQHDGRRRPAALSGSSVPRATTRETAATLYAQRHDVHLQ